MKGEPKNKNSTKVTLEDNSTLGLPTLIFFQEYNSSHHASNLCFETTYVKLL